MKEIWKNIPDYDGYLISNLGNVYSLKSNKKMTVCHNDKGYFYAHLIKNGIQHQVKLHRLVAKAFIPNPNNLSEVNHIDNNKANNCVNNLEWCSIIDNIRKAFKDNLISRKANKTSYSSKKVFLYDLNNNLLNIYNSLSEASKDTGINIRNISRYCLGQRKSKTHIWRYAEK